jgi:FkbM family methyltransferase
LLNNLSDRRCLANVGTEGGVAELFEPHGHLTNSSLDPNFARLFSNDVRSNRVLVIGGDELAAIAPDAGRTLLKIDVEGAEPLVLNGLRSWVAASRPDVILEVLPGFDRALRDQDYFGALGYRFMRVEERGPVEVTPYEASNKHRDHLLLAP